jgi:UDP-N-acetylmuramate--alanine ligase
MVSRPVLGYGLDDSAELRACAVQAEPGGRMRFTVRQRDTRANRAWPDLAVTLNLPGVHNVRNALAAIAVARELGVADEPVVRALAGFAGVGRRFQRHGELPCAGGGHYTLVDDYGHHPVEMDAVREAARGAFPGRRLVLAFQPHRYTRTRDCFEDFVAVMGRFDAVLLTEVYPAGEAPIVAADGRALARALRVAGRVDPLFVESVEALEAAIAQTARDADVVITMGAGSISGVPRRLVQAETGEVA